MLTFSSSSTVVTVAIGIILSLSLFPMVLGGTSTRTHAAAALEIGGEMESVCEAKTTPSWCPVKCFRTSPVCGVDGVTYWCGCAEAECAGTKVAKMGFCEVGSGGSTPLPLQALLSVHIVCCLGIFWG